MADVFDAEEFKVRRFLADEERIDRDYRDFRKGFDEMTWARMSADSQYSNQWVNACCLYGCDCGECYSRSPDKGTCHCRLD